MKKSLPRSRTVHDISTPQNITIPVSSTIGAAMPSTPRASVMALVRQRTGPRQTQPVPGPGELHASIVPVADVVEQEDVHRQH